jgi:hypothetical protein
LKKEEITEAFRGCWGLYFNTTSEDPTVDEITAGKNIVDAAVEAGVQHVVYSGAAAVKELTKGEVPLMMMDSTPPSS